MATSAPGKYVTQAQLAEADATISDHRPLSFALLPEIPTQRPIPTGNQNERKPIGWVLVELDYNDGICERVGMDIPVDIAEIMKDAYHIYTDGSFTGHRCHTAKDKCSRRKQATNNATACKAGWGVAIFDRGPPPQDEDDILPFVGQLFEAEPTSASPHSDGRLSGRVTTTAESIAGVKGHVGARKRTNNTAEVQAVIETLFFLLSQVDLPKRSSILSRPSLSIRTPRTPSTVSATAPEPPQTPPSGTLLVHLWKRTRCVYDIRIVWVRGHSKGVGNELADLLAGQGADEDVNTDRWSWRPRDRGYWEVG